MVSMRRRSGGFTLVELLISVAVMGIVVMYLMQTFTTQQRTYVVVDQVTEVQQNLRAIGDLLEREVRLAGFMVDEAGAVCGVDSTGASDVLFLSDGSAIDPANQIEPRLGARLAGGSAPAAGLVTLNLGFGDSVVLEGSPAYDTDGDGVNDSDFRIGAGAIVFDRDNPGRGAACGIVSDVPTAASVQVDFLADTLGPAGATSQLVVVPAHIFQVDGNAQLLRDGMVLAPDVEDMQVAFFFDVDGNNQVTTVAGEYPGSAGGAVYDASSWDNRQLREVRVSFVVRSRAADPTFSDGHFQATENRAVVVGSDGFRRRVHTTTVRTRNVGNRGLLNS